MASRRRFALVRSAMRPRQSRQRAMPSLSTTIAAITLVIVLLFPAMFFGELRRGIRGLGALIDPLAAIMWIQPSRFATAGGGGGVFGSYLVMQIDSGMVAGSDKTNFRFYFEATDAALKATGSGGVVVNQNHIRVATDAAGTTLRKYDIEYWDGTAGTVKGWVLVPTLSASADTILYLVFDDNGITTYQGDRANTWADDSLRFHLGDGSSISGVDEVSGFNLTAAGSPTAIAGQVHGAVNFARASSQHMSRVGDATHVLAGSAFTVGAWYKPTSFSGGLDTIISYGDSATRNFAIDVNGSGQPRFFFTQGAGNFKGFTSSTALATGVWSWVVATFDGTTQRLYINGVPAGTNAVSGSPDTPGGTVVFSLGSLNTTDNANGGIDEAFLTRTITRDGDWILTEYRNQSNPTAYTEFYLPVSPYSDSRMCTVDASLVGSSDLTDFPVPVTDTIADLKHVNHGGTITGSSNVAFYADAGFTTLLAFERVIHNKTTGFFEYYVKIPTLSHTTNTVFYMQWDTTRTTSLADRVNTWDSGFFAVYHAGDGTAISAQDSTSNANHLTNNGATAAAGLFGGAFSVTGGTDLTTPVFGGSVTAMTISYLAKPSATSSSIGVVFSRASSPPVGSQESGCCSDGTMSYNWRDDASTYNWNSGLKIVTGTWSYVSIAVGATSGVLRVDSSSATNAISHASQPLNGIFRIGRDSFGGRNFSGLLDEVRFSNVKRSADWQLAEKNSLKSPSTFCAVT
jgi:hypothetical protein